MTGAIYNLYHNQPADDWIFVRGSSFTSSSAVAYTIRNGFVSVFIIHNSTAAGWVKLANLPSEVRPPHKVGSTGYNSGSYYYIEDNGDVYVYMLDSATCQTYPKE